MKTMTINKSEAAGLAADLKAVILYDDFKLAARAATLLEQVMATPDFDVPVRWDIGPWRLEALQHPGLAARALAEAAGADLILLALAGGDRVQEDVLAWLENWARQRQEQDPAIMFFCPNEAAAATRLVSELKWFTVRQGLTFLDSHVGWAPGPARGRPADPDPSPFRFGMDLLIPSELGYS